MNSLRIETLSSITTSNICIPYNYVKLHMISCNTPIIFQNPLTLSEKAWRRWASLLTPQPKPMGPSGDPVTRHHRRAADLERSDLCAVGHMSLHALDTWGVTTMVMAIAKRCEHVLTPLFVIHAWIPSKTQKAVFRTPVNTMYVVFKCIQSPLWPCDWSELNTPIRAAPCASGFQIFEYT